MAGHRSGESFVVEQMNGFGKLAVTALDRNQDKVLAEGTTDHLDSRSTPPPARSSSRARFENADGKLFPNQFVNVRLHLPAADHQRRALTIPANAVQRSTGSIYVRGQRRQQGQPAQRRSPSAQRERARWWWKAA